MPLLRILCLFWLASYFLILSFSGKAEGQTPNCPCEQIREEGKCDNPDCIEICNLQDVFIDVRKRLKDKCLEDGTRKKTLSALDAGFGTIKGFIGDLREIEEKNVEVINDNCPACHLFSEIDSKITPKPKDEKCDEYVYTEHYKKWRNKTLENNNFCKPKALRGGGRFSKKGLTAEQKKICREEYEDCCDSLYLKTHEYDPYTTQVKVEEGESCGNDQVTKLNENMKAYVDSILDSDSEMSKKLWLECPKGCSFAVIESRQMDTMIKKTDTGSYCSATLKLKVKCIHSRRAKLLGSYDVEITYKGEAQCTQ